MTVNTFMFYQVKLAITNHHQTVTWQGNLLTPQVAWARVDQPLWTDLEKRITRLMPESSVMIQVQPSTEVTSLYHLETTSLTSMSERRTWLTNISQQFGIQACPVNLEERRLAYNLAGRKLLLTEVLSVWHQAQDMAEISAANMNLQKESSSTLCTLQRLYLQGFFDWYAAIGQKEGRPYCRRCGYGLEKKPASLLKGLKQLLGLSQPEALIPVACQRCGEENCYYCPRCLEMGRAKACEPLIIWNPEPLDQLPSKESHFSQILEPLSTVTNQHIPDKNIKQVPFHWTGELSPAQKEASKALFHFVHSTESMGQSGKEYLLWAVCGAGKTEILYETIHHALQKGQKVLITSPRRDVILELSPRLKQAFPQTVIRTLYAESTEKFLAGELFLATTHQTLRFERFFDLVILDEEDAFPYHHDPLLPYAVQQAKKPEATTIYLTATPRPAMIRELETGRLAYTLLSKRYHGHPLAVPVIQPIGKWRKQMKKGALLTPLIHYVTHLARQNRFGYLFVPHVADLELVQTYLIERIIPYLLQQPWVIAQEKAYLQKITIETVHAQHPERTAIVQRFRKQKIHILITTTILERGVTIPYSDVAVVGSDDPVFDTAALIQIAGRVGRKPEDPVGHVWFFPESRTNAQLRCIRQIKEWNQS